MFVPFSTIIQLFFRVPLNVLVRALGGTRTPGWESLIYIYMYIYTYMYTYIYIYIDVCVCVCVCVCDIHDKIKYISLIYICRFATQHEHSITHGHGRHKVYISFHHSPHQNCSPTSPFYTSAHPTPIVCVEDTNLYCACLVPKHTLFPNDTNLRHSTRSVCMKTFTYIDLTQSTGDWHTADETKTTVTTTTTTTTTTFPRD